MSETIESGKEVISEEFSGNIPKDETTEEISHGTLVCARVCSQEYSGKG